MDKRKKLISIFIFIIVSMLIGIIVFAATNSDEKNYSVAVKDNGSTNVYTDDNNTFSFKTELVNTTDTELTYETTIKNIREEKAKNCLIVYIDTSYSMSENSEFEEIRAKAKAVVEKFYDEVNNPRVIIADNSGSVISSNIKSNSISQIEGLTIGQTGSTEKILTDAYDSVGGYSNSEYSKSMVIFSDATDNIKTKLEEAKNNNIKVYSVLPGITSTSFGTINSPVPDNATMFMAQEYDSEELSNRIIDEICKALINVKYENIFNSEILKSETKGNFTLEIINATSGTVKTYLDERKISWEIEKIGVNKTAKLTFKLKLNTNKTIDSDSLYTDIISNDTTTVTCTPYLETQEKTKTVNNTSPTIQICDAYTLKIKAIGEKSKKIVTEGVTFNVTATDEYGNDLPQYKTTETVNSDGEIIIPKVKELGKVYFNIAPSVSVVGFSNSNSIYVGINNDYFGSGITVERYDNYQDIINDNGKRSVTINVPISEQTFKIDLELSDYNNESLKLVDREFQLILPKLNDIYTMDAMYAKTDNSGKLTFEVPVMTKEGEYRYILSQLTTKDDYEKIGNPTIIIKFDDKGNVVKISEEDGIKIDGRDTNVTGIWVSSSEVQLKALNKNQKLRTFNFQLKLRDENTKEGIGGTSYNITSIQSIDGENRYPIIGEVTNDEGNINVDVPYKATGIIKIEVQEIKTNDAYIANSDMSYPDNKATYYIKIDDTGYIDPSYLIGGIEKNPANTNGVILNLTSKKKTEQNVIKVNLKQKDDGAVLSGVNVTLRKVDGTDEMTATADGGIATFTLPAPDKFTDGTYEYEVLIKNIPNGYKTPTINGNLAVVVNEGKISVSSWDKNNGITGNPLENLNFSIEKKTINTEYTLTCDFILETESANELYIQLKDGENSSNIEGGNYSISISNPKLSYVFSTTRTTNSSGITEKISIPYVDETSDTIITVKQEAYEKGKAYKKNNYTYEITLRKNGTGMTIVNTVLSTTATVEYGDGNTNTNKIILTDTNLSTKFDDLVWNLNLFKYFVSETGKTAIGNMPIMVWTDKDDFSAYDSETNTFKSIQAADKYIITTSNTGDSRGHASCMLKPKLEMSGKDSRYTQTKTIYIAEYDTILKQPIEDSKVTLEVQFQTSVDGTNWEMIFNGRIHNGAENAIDGNITATYDGIIDGNRSYTTEFQLKALNKISNFAIDFTKYAYAENISDRKKLAGSQYIVEVKSPNGSTTGANSYAINNDDNTVDVSGLYIQEGSTIEIKEDPAHTTVGYQCDEKGEIFRVDKIDESTGIATLTKSTSNSDPAKIEIEEITTNSDGICIAKINLINSELNELKMGIKTVDAGTGKELTGNTYYISTSSGAQKLTESKEEKKGQINTTIGGNKKDQLVTYTITQTIPQATEVTQYYKRISGSIKVKAYFDSNGKIVADPTDSNFYGNIQDDPNYGITWEIIGVNGDNKLDILIKKEKAAALKVNVKTVDKFSGDVISGVANYEITPSENITATGTTNLQVGYIQEGTRVSYTLKTTLNGNTYQVLNDQQFAIQYTTDGKITVSGISAIGNNIEISPNASNDETIDIKVYLEPTLVFQVSNTTYFGENKLDGATFTILNSNESEESEIGTTDSAGEALIHYSTYENAGTTKTYIVRQKSSGRDEIAKIKDFKIDIVFGNDGTITNTTLSPLSQEVANLVNIVPTNITENGVSKTAIKINIKSYPAFRMNITNIEKGSDSSEFTSPVYLPQSQYSIVSTIPTQNSGTPLTNSNGQTTAYIDRTEFNTSVTYRIQEIQTSYGYQALKSPIDIKVIFDKDGHVDLTNMEPVKVTDGDSCASAEAISSVDASVNPEDYFAINVTIKNAPKFRANITNIDKITETQLGGSTWKMYLETADPKNANEGTAAQSSKIFVPVDEETPINNSEIYVIENTKAAVGYQKIHAKIRIRVQFDENGYVSNAVLLDGADYVKNKDQLVITVKSISTDYFAIDVIMKSAPNSVVNITNVDRTDSNNIQLGSSIWEVSLEGVNADENPVTTGTASATSVLPLMVNGETPINTTAVYVIKNIQAASDYQKIENPIRIQVDFDENGHIKISENTFTILQGDYCVENIEVINPRNSANSSEYYTFNITIKSAPKTKVNITNVDRKTRGILTESEWSVELENSGYSATNSQIPSSATGTSVRVDGETPINSDATYIIKNTKATTGYQRIEKDIRIKVTFDGNGFIVNNNSTLTVEGDRVYCVDGSLLTVEPVRNNPEDYYTFNITIISTPLSQINLTNIGRADNIELNNSEWKVELEGTTEAPASNITTVSGKATVDVNGETPFDGETIYKITNIDNHGNGYQVLSQPIRVKVHFTSSQMDNISIEQGDGDIAKELYTPATTLKEHLTFNITIKNSPLIKMYIDNYDRSDSSVSSLVGAEFNIHTKDQHNAETDDATAKTTTDPAEKSVQGDTGISSEVTYTISQTKGAAGYQTIDPKEIKIYFKDNGEIDTARLNEAILDASARNYIEIEAVNPATNNQDKFTLKITIRNNPLIAVTIHTVTTGGNNVPGAQISGKATDITDGKNDDRFTYPTSETPVAPTDANGITTIYMDKGLDSSTIRYTIDEDQVAGFEKLPITGLVDVTYNGEGKIADDSNVSDSTVYTDSSHRGLISMKRTGDFSIEITIQNEEIGNFSIEVYTVDRYDPGKYVSSTSTDLTGKALDGAEIATIVNKNHGATNSENTNVNNNTIATANLTTGVAPNGVIHGYSSEDYGGNLKFGKVSDTENITKATVVLELTNAPTSYYSYDDEKTYSSSYYEYYEKSRKVKLNVTFDDEGRITKIENKKTDNNGYYPSNNIWNIKDSKYGQSMLVVENTDHKIKITIAYTPMLTAQMKAVSDYEDGKELSASYRIKLRRDIDYSESTFDNYSLNFKVPDRSMGTSSDSWANYYKDKEQRIIPSNLKATGKSDVIDDYYANKTITYNDKNGNKVTTNILGAWKMTPKSVYWTKFLPSRIYNQSTGKYEAQTYSISDINTKRNDVKYNNKMYNMQKFYIYETDNRDYGLLPNEPKDDSEFEYYGTNESSEQYFKLSDITTPYQNVSGIENTFDNLWIATVCVLYNEKGEVEKTAIYNKEDSKKIKYNSSNKTTNIDFDTRNSTTTSTKKSGQSNNNMSVNISEDKHGVEVTMGYSRTTTIEAKVIDATTNEPIKNIIYKPFDSTKGNGTYIRYTLSDYNKWTSNDNGELKTTAPTTILKGDTIGLFGNTGTGLKLAENRIKMTYNYKNVANGNKIFNLKYESNKKSTAKGYIEPKDISLNVQYDSIGEITETAYDSSGNVTGATYVASKYSDAGHTNEANAVITSIDNTTVNLNILYYRMFKTKLNSVDKYNNANIAGAEYNVTAKDKDGNILFTRTNFKGDSDVDFAKAYPGQTIEYTIEQANKVKGYQDLEPFSFKITYLDGTDATGANVRGKIGRIELSDGRVLYDGTTIYTLADSPIDITKILDWKPVKDTDENDLEIAIKRTPTVSVNLTLRDQFYQNETIDNVFFKVTVKEGSTTLQTQTAQTGTSGAGSVEIDLNEIYLNRDITFTIHQENTPAGYYDKESDIQITAHFDNTGTITSYIIDKGSDNQLNLPQPIGTRNITANIYNKPREVKMGIYKYDGDTKEALSDVEFTITKEGGTSAVYSTDSNGYLTLAIDNFEKNPTAERDAIYTITENAAKPSYRKIKDIKFRLHYNNDGSIAFKTDVDVPSTGVAINVTTSGSLIDMNGNKVAVQVNIENDNWYDVVIKDEDKNYSGLGIEGTQYDLSINGDTKVLSPTGTDGTTIQAKNKENGKIEISVAEMTIGRGYRSDANNNIKLEFEKGTDEYSLKLKTSLLGGDTSTGYKILSKDESYISTSYGNGIKYEIEIDKATGTIADVSVYEETGKIEIIFKNESKSEIILSKIDAKTQEALSGAKFQITSQEIDDYGNPVGEVTTITSNSAIDYKTNDEGKLTIDIGVRPQNKTIKYTFEETVAPDGYNKVEIFNITCKYDQYGNITTDGGDSGRVYVVENRFDLELTVTNGDEPEGYSIKIVSADSQSTGNRINGSKFNVIVKDGDGNIITSTPSANEETATVPNNFGTNENGVIYLKGITKDGNASIEVAQTGLTSGYSAGSNTIHGTVKVNTVFEAGTVGSLTTQPKFTLINDGGFADVILDEKYKEIIIVVTNDPQITLDIHKISSIKDKDGNEIVIPNVNFTVTSEIDNGTYTTKTDLNVTGTTDKEGNTSIPLGMPSHSQKVIYTIKEEKIDGYESGLEFKIFVEYYNNGTIYQYWNISDSNIANKLKIENKNSEGAIIGGRNIPVIIENEMIANPIPYKVIIQTETNDGIPIENIPIQLTVTESNNIAGKGTPVYPIKQTKLNTNGKAETEYYEELNGYGTIQFLVSIEDAAQINLGYQFGKDMNVEITKDEKTGAISETGSNNLLLDVSEYDDIEGNHIIRLIAKAKVGNDNYITNIYKMSSASQTAITKNPANFTVIQYSPVESEEVEEQDDKEESKDTENSDGTKVTPATKYKIEYNKNTTDNVTNMPTSQEFAEDSGLVKLDRTSPVRENYIFRGWSETTTVDDYDQLTRAGDDFAVDNKNYTLYAVWTKESEYFEGEGTEIISGESTGDAGIINKNTLEVPDKAGWYRYSLTENKAPTGYKGLEKTVSIDVHFVTSEDTGVMYISETKSNSNKVDVKLSDSGKIMNIYVYNDEDIGENNYALNLYKVDGSTVPKNRDATTTPVTQLSDALFKIKLPDSYGTSIYAKSGEKQTDSAHIGRLEYSYIEEEKDYSVRLSRMIKPTMDEIKAAGGKVTHTYTFDEATAPDGYGLIGTPLTLDVDFAIITEDDGTEKIHIVDARSSDPSILKINTEVSTEKPVDQLSIYILNSKVKSTYTVHYEANTTDTVTNMPADQLKQPGVSLTLDANIPVRDGFTFLGWDPDATATIPTYRASGTYAIDTDITLYAIWTVAEYTIHYEDNAPIDVTAGVAVGAVTGIPVDNTKTHGIDISLSTDIPSIPLKSNDYTFAGWSTEPDGSSSTATWYNPGDNYTIDADLTLYAQWNFVIHYDANLPVDEYAMPIVSIVNDMPYSTSGYKQEEKINGTTPAVIDDLSKFTNAPSVPVEDGEKEEPYIFVEWNTKPDGTGNSYNPNDLYADTTTGIAKKESITLYAIWKYRITYNENRPLYNYAPSSVKIDNMPSSPEERIALSTIPTIPGTVKISSNIPNTNPGDYTFAGWNTKADGTGETYSPDDVYKGNKKLTLYAQWNYNVKYVANEPIINSFPVGTASNIPKNQVDNSINTTVIIDDLSVYTDAPTLDGYVFKGWDPDPNLDLSTSTPKYQPNDVYSDCINTTLYAIWEEETLYLKSTEYIISTENNYATDENATEYVDGDTYMFGIKPAVGAIQNKPENEGTNVDKLKANIETNADKIEVVDSENNVLGESDLVGTGMKLILTKGKQRIEITLIVLGDINGNGVLDGSDKTNASKYITVNDKTRFDTIEKILSLDVNLNGKVQPSDLSMLRKALSEDDNSGMGV